jgi:hypothetical protein
VEQLQEMSLGKWGLWRYPFISPFLRATVKGTSAQVQMLYESGAASNAELFRVYKTLLDAEDCSQQIETKNYQQGYWQWFNHEAFLPVLEKMATIPRSLQSLSRQVISHCLDSRGRLQRAVEYLPVLFSPNEALRHVRGPCGP